MPDQVQSPRVLNLSWGRVKVEDHGTFKDVKLFPGGCRKWDWRETGTDHEAGIQPADVQDLLDHGAGTVILSRGVFKRLQVNPETMSLLESLQIKTHILPTRKAVELYNSLCNTEAVGALIHSTC